MEIKIDTMKNPRDKSRKRKQEDLDAGSLSLSTYDCDVPEIKKIKKSTCDCDVPEIKKSTYDCDVPEIKKIEKSTFNYVRNMVIAKRLKRFSYYAREEEEEEKSLGVSTKLQLSINGDETTDPWKIKKRLEQSDCDHLCRLMLRKDTVHNYIFNVWEDAGKIDEIAKVLDHQGGGVAVKVWDYERGKEYELKFKKLISSQCYILSGAWSTKFVKERRLKKGDTIGLYWSTSKSRFVFSVRARAPPPPPAKDSGFTSLAHQPIAAIPLRMYACSGDN